MTEERTRRETRDESPQQTAVALLFARPLTHLSPPPAYVRYTVPTMNDRNNMNNMDWDAPPEEKRWYNHPQDDDNVAERAWVEGTAFAVNNHDHALFASCSRFSHSDSNEQKVRALNERRVIVFDRNADNFAALVGRESFHDVVDNFPNTEEGISLRTRSREKLSTKLGHAKKECLDRLRNIYGSIALRAQLPSAPTNALLVAAGASAAANVPVQLGPPVVNGASGEFLGVNEKYNLVLVLSTDTLTNS